MHTVIIGVQIRICNIQILDYTALHIAKKRVERIVAYLDVLSSLFSGR